MSSLVLLSGRVSGAKIVSETTGRVNKGRGSVSTSHKTLFRIDGKPVCFDGTPNLDDDDMVTVVGKAKSEFKARALRNDSTGALYFQSVIFLCLLGVLGIAIGSFINLAVFTSKSPIEAAYGLGALFTCGGFFFTWEGVNNFIAKQMLVNASNSQEKSGFTS